MKELSKQDIQNVCGGVSSYANADGQSVSAVGADGGSSGTGQSVTAIGANGGSVNQSTGSGFGATPKFGNTVAAGGFTFKMPVWEKPVVPAAGRRRPAAHDNKRIPG